MSSEISRSIHLSQFSVGGVSVQMAGCREADVGLVPPLEPFRVEVGLSDIHIRVERVAHLPQSSGRQLFHSGTTWKLHEAETGLQFDFNAAIFGDRSFKRLLTDDVFRQATLQMSDDCLGKFPRRVEPLGYPLDELLIMHRLTQEKGIELHGCGIVRGDGVGNLFVGHSGAGKSTTTRLWTEREDVEVLSDDRIIVRIDEGGSGVGTRSGAAGAADEHEVPRLRDCPASRSNHFARDDRGVMDRLQKQVPPLRFAQGRDDNGRSGGGGMRMYGTPWHGEAMYASPGSAPLARIFVLEHGRGNVVTRLSPSQAVGELFARSFVPFHRHEYVESALEFLQELVGAVPVYHYAFEPTEAAVERILEFCD
jgi:hypothetical protein